MADRNNRGKQGEDAACRYLKKAGCRILDRNVRCRFGEIDIIAQDGEYLCFVEVKTRSANAIARPLEFVDARKQQRIRTTAQWYLQSHPGDRQPRFDVVEIIIEPGEKFLVRAIQRIPNAF